MKTRTKRILLWAALAVLSAADLFSGGVFLGLGEIAGAIIGGGAAFDGTPWGMASDSAIAGIVRDIRIPRVLTSILAGASLALAGVQMQAIFRNPLADPHIMGVSAGAGTGAAVATLAVTGVFSGLAAGMTSGLTAGVTVAASAFAGALAASALIILMAGKMRDTAGLLIFGVMTGFVFSAISSIMAYFANEESLKMFYSWSAGSFSGQGYDSVGIMAAAAIIGTAISAYNSKGLDIVLFGEEYAEAVGASVKRIRTLAIISCCIVTGAVTAFCGPVGFIGIAAPHIARRIEGSSRHRDVTGTAMITGASMALAADILSHLFIVPLPVGSTAALLGVPVILHIFLKKP